MATGDGIGRQGLFKNGIDDTINVSNTAMDRRLFRHQNLGADDLAARNQTQRTFNGKGEEQPQRDQSPQKGKDALRHFSKNYSNQYNRKCEIRCGYSQIDHLQE